MVVLKHVFRVDRHGRGCWSSVTKKKRMRLRDDVTASSKTLTFSFIRKLETSRRLRRGDKQKDSSTMVRVKRSRRPAALDPLRLMTRHLFAAFTVATVFCCVSVYFFFLNVEVSLNRASRCSSVRVKDVRILMPYVATMLIRMRETAIAIKSGISCNSKGVSSYCRFTACWWLSLSYEFY